MSIVVARLAGGLGNQMFQYAKGYAESVERNSYLKLDLRGYKKYTLHGGFRLNKLNIDNTFVMSKKEMFIFPNFMVRAINKFPKVSLYSKRFESEQYSKMTNGSKKGMVEFIGFWQNERYFLEHKIKLREKFIPINISLDAKELSDVIRCVNSVSVHIRRGDYVSNVEALKTHGLCTEEYYIESIRYLKGKFNGLVFFVFSDDIEWCKKYKGKIFSRNDDVKFIEGNTQEVDMWLMSNAKYHIIANSSFSWWGAWLKHYDLGITIAPTPWFEREELNSFDPCPEKWVRIKK